MTKRLPVLLFFMAGSKKRKEPAQSSTLHDFFASSSAKKTRNSGTSVSKPAKRVVEHLEAEDIIVISDDEEDYHKDLTQPHIISKYSNFSCDTSVKRNSESLTFGSTALLSENKMVYPQTLKDWPELDTISRKSFPHNIRTPLDVISSGDESELESTRLGEWAMGDDEDVSFQAEADSDMEEVKVELCQGDYSNTDSGCPVCGKQLKGLFESVNHGLSVPLNASNGLASTGS